ncbi:Crp/Fnr family transcriptional regulator [Acidovorax sp. A1169]|jgi:CRP/FNR family cyclic AMP-dependent transcriptional regulator|uniref:Crp/Fnr family transcriptional regulator n=1 Tax=Acidovorax sp. A1169 TaxID=3059524 RepID=UPI00273798AB|nr:Crp/Fnr family transcriptional regulator [Acidovorax sp. A1169]MDP4072965.1 Crp/Fnr family transcriptional regulator [Acidovorax sp. A1169]
MPSQSEPAPDTDLPAHLGHRADERLRLPKEVQDALLQVAHRRQLQRGDSLFLKGSAPDALFGMVQGALRVSVAAPDGREAVIAVLEPGHWFGEVSLFVGQQRVYDTCAVEPSEVAVVQAADFHHLIATQPALHMAFTRLVCLRLRQALAWIDDAILQPLSVRLAHRLVTLDSRPASAESTTVVLAVSQEDLAFMLGVSRQSINRQLKQWEEEGMLRVGYRVVELLDRERLARYVAQAA